MSNMNFIESNKIKVFPCGGRDSQYDAAAKLTTEYNLVSIINRLVDQKSFVVSDTVPSIISVEGENTFATDFVFNLNGYLFSTTDATFGLPLGGENSPSKNSYIVAYIDQYNYVNNETTYILLRPLGETMPDTPTSVSLYGGMLDASAKFKGIGFALINLSQIPFNGSSNLTLGIGSYTFEFSPRSSDITADGTIRITDKLLPILLFDGNNWFIPPDSKIKFKTTKDGLVRSVVIDDGDLD